jgi:low affinity Fe/Cu permease
VRDVFARFASTSAHVLGSAWTFSLYIASIVLWLIVGPLMHFSDTWQLLANTSTTLFTTAVCLLIQNTVNRDTKALHVKLDELLRAHEQARTELVDVEHRSQKEVDEREREYAHLHDEVEPGAR